MMKKKQIYIVSLGLALLLFSCEYYIGLNQQPKFVNKHTEEGLNVFGLLRPDSTEGFNKSFVYVNRVFPALELEGYDILKPAFVKIDKIVQDSLTESVVFSLLPSQTVRTDTVYRPATYFSPGAGERYRLTCKYEGMPDAIGETIIPSKPQIDPETIIIDRKMISFSLLPDSLTGMVDIYQIADNDNHLLVSRLVTFPDRKTDVEIILPFDHSGTRLMICAYDQNMAAYIGNSNISLNFNKFRTTISTLMSGFGVFGSMNFYEMEL
ncbi:MAG: hypothetical protein IPI37_01355 [Bacteroidales bacterium]|jgi:hypothetical protein|nr:hypothetical protein [Bacteroidales bacterium]MBP7035272.1 hypothetical protein [Bacteroidales bacterium]MZQ79468.1 hypothetical protein [Bacteroidales bacterium]HNV65520.1 hypothetical protein [Bacteroidales bacterium]HNY56758.1 hypothetical protein [Bacteroidales bacterium]